MSNKAIELSCSQVIKEIKKSNSQEKRQRSIEVTNESNEKTTIREIQNKISKKKIQQCKPIFKQENI